VAAVLVLSLGGAALAGYRYDLSRASRILPGVTIAGVDVGGMTRAEAEQALSASAGPILDRLITVRAAGHSIQVTPGRLGTKVDVEGAIDQALAVSDAYGWPSRVYHRLFDKPVPATIDLAVTNDPAEVARFVEAMVERVDRPAQDATRDFEDGHLLVQHSRKGLSLSAKGARRAVMGAVRGPASKLDLKTHPVLPTVSDDQLGMLIVVRISQNRLYLYDGVKLVKSYSVATGQSQYPTPRGHFEIVNKRVNPTWVNPATTTWGKDEPPMIPPGPDNPLGTRALDLSAPGIRIHGTPDDASIGSYASHGCIRMHIPDSEDLFNRVEIGTTVIIAE
jgi:lipoprotein-anchoring transpeptidase ErfK/SrfK